MWRSRFRRLIGRHHRRGDNGIESYETERLQPLSTGTGHGGVVGQFGCTNTRFSRTCQPAKAYRKSATPLLFQHEARGGFSFGWNRSTRSFHDEEAFKSAMKRWAQSDDEDIDRLVSGRRVNNSSAPASEKHERRESYASHRNRRWTRTLIESISSTCTTVPSKAELANKRRHGHGCICAVQWNRLEFCPPARQATLDLKKREREPSGQFDYSSSRNAADGAATRGASATDPKVVSCRFRLRLIIREIGRETLRVGPDGNVAVRRAKRTYMGLVVFQWM